MGDRHSDSSDQANLEEANFGIRGNPKDINQVSSSGRDAQRKRSTKALESLAEAGKKLEQELNKVEQDRKK